MSAWTTGVLGGITLLGVVFGDVTSVVLGAALIALAVREGRWATRLTRFETRAPRMLAVNQVALGVVILLYAAWQAYAAYRSTGLSSGVEATGDARADALLADVGALTRRITIGFYGVVAVGGLLGTSLMALYYMRCTARLKPFLAATPTWVLQAMRAAA